MRKYLLFFLIFVATPLLNQTLPLPYNLDFEIGEPGKLPKGWTVPSYAEKLGYQAYLTTEEPFSGKYCLELFREGKYQEDIYGSVMQSIDATPYRGKTIRFRAYIRAEIHSPKGSAHIWVRERSGNDEESGFFEYLPNQPAVLRQWEVREIQGKISKNATTINFGLLLFGNGKAWIDSASFEIVQETNQPAEKIQISTEQIQDLLDFAKVYGVVRYFHPLSDFSYNWDCFALNSVTFILKNPDIPIHKKIHKLFEHYLITDSQNEYDSTGYLFWIHNGLPSEKPHPFLGSRKANLLNPLRKSPGIVQQVINIEKYRGRKAKFSVYYLGELYDKSAKILLAVRYDDDNNKQISFEVKQFLNSTKQWQKIELTTQIPQNASFAKPAIILIGEGDCFFDDATFKIDNDEENLLQNDGFEMSKDSLLVYSWRPLEISTQSGYLAFVTKSIAKSGAKSLHLYSDPETRIATPDIGNIYTIKLHNDSLIRLPLVLPNSMVERLSKETPTIEDCHFSLNDKMSQVSILISFWNFVKHFDIYLKNEAELEKWLKESLLKLNQIETPYEFYTLLSSLTNHIEDNFSRILHKDFTSEKSFPFLWKEIDGKIFLTDLALQNTKAEIGDEVIKINSYPVNFFIDSIASCLSYTSKSWKFLKTLAYIRNNLPTDTIILTLKKPNGEVFDETFTKSITSLELVEKRPEKFQIFRNNVVYLDLTRLSEKELKDILDTLTLANYFIFDLRGISLVSEQFLSLFSDQTIEIKTWKLPVFTIPDQKQLSWQVINTKINGKSHFSPKEVFFLVDKRTIGISEVIAEIVKTNKIGKLIGEQTGGNPMEMVSYPLPGGFTFYFGTFVVFDSSGKQISSKGISPNIPVKEKTGKEYLTQDQILEKALYLINQR